MKHPAFCKILQQYVWQLFGGMQCLVCGCQCLVVVAAGYAQYRFLGIFMFVLFDGILMRLIQSFITVTYCLFLMRKSCSQIYLYVLHKP